MRVIYVDGYKIRQELDADFNILHLQSDNPALGDSKWYIPRGEIWLDHNWREEEKWLVAMETTDVADGSREAYKKKFGETGDPGVIVAREEMKEGLKVQYIDGAKVRRYLDPWFAMGGHDKVYDCVPKETVWLEKNLDPRDVEPILEHELVERRLMAQGMSYDNAHGWATAAEKESRRAAGGCYIGDDGHSRQLNIKDFYVEKTDNQKIAG